MKGSVRGKVIKYGISSVFCLGLAALYVGLRDFSLQSTMEKYRILCDAFTIPGLVLVMLGALMAVSNEGALDGVAYVLSYAVKILIPGKRHEHEKYYDYVERKRQQGRVKGYGFLFVVGGISLAIAIIFMILFYRLYR